MNPSSLLRSLATAAAPLTVLATGLVVVAASTAGAAVESSPFAVASTALLLIAVLGIGAAAVLALGRLRDAGRGSAPAAVAVAVVGTVLVAGGQWAALFVLPALSEHAPALLASGALSSVMVGYVASYAVFALGWVATAVGLLRARVVPAWLGGLLLVGGLASMVPAPEAMRLLIVSLAATLAARRMSAPSPVDDLATQPA